MTQHRSKIRVTVTEAHFGDVIAELHRKGSLIFSMKHESGRCVIEADAPILEIGLFEKWFAHMAYAEDDRVEFL